MVTTKDVIGHPVIEANTSNPTNDLLQQILLVNQQILAELQKQTPLLNNLSRSLSQYGGQE